MNINKKIIMLMLILTIIIGGCATNITKEQTSTTSEIQKIEVIHFHGATQCSSCIAVGRLAEETVNENFKEELTSGKITFAHINAELPENRAIAQKYGVTGSSLWIGVYYTDGNFSKESNSNVWYKINDPVDYKTYLTSIIKEKFEKFSEN